MIRSFDFYDEQALLERLSTSLRKRTREVVFLVGAPLSAPLNIGQAGVPDSEGMIDLIRREFDGETTEREALETQIGSSQGRRYQAAFSFLQGRRGQQTVNEIVCKAVLTAREMGSLPTDIDFANQAAMESLCRGLELDFAGWHLNTGTENLGKLVTGYPSLFGHRLLTTNFDPLIEVAIRRAGGSYWRTVLHSDGDLSQTEASGCHVIHLHGYWFGVDTLHTARQLSQPRPRLKESLRALLRNKLVVVCAYGGWDDAFTESLMQVVRDITEFPEILWTFHSEQPTLEEGLRNRLEPGLDRGRVNLYAGIDCNRFFPQLYQRWLDLESPVLLVTSPRSNPVHVSEALTREVQRRSAQQKVIEGNDEDRPPFVEICVGREVEFKVLRESNARIVFLTGIGGQGKSTVAAQFFTTSQHHRAFSLYVWRDCKEERERFENQLASVIEKLSGGRISGADLARQSSASIVELLTDLVKDQYVLFTFDNVDHLVDLESGSLTGTADMFVKALLKSCSGARAVFTCRPRIEYDHPLVLSTHLEGLSLDASLKLFVQRGAPSTPDEIKEAHELTEGHAFWLDLLAIQVGKQHGATKLRTLVAQISSGSGLLPDKTLTSVWGTLKDREQVVLRAMAETVKPETELELGDYLSDQLTFNKVVKTLRNLRTLNLVVVKKPTSGPDFLELHPLVRHFIRSNFPQKERASFIDLIIKVYDKWIRTHKVALRERPSLLVLQHWTQSAELDIAAGKFEQAFTILAEVAETFLGSAYPREFSRVCRNLLDAVDWVSNHGKFKEFELLFHMHARILADLGEHVEVEGILDKYALTVEGKDVRYIAYCNIRCYSTWAKGEFAQAVTWGEEGLHLQTSTGVDTETDISYHLALALRDVGRPESALPIFLQGRTLSEVTDPEELDEARGGHYYGNIGRCLHFMGQIDEALVCYQKSALVLERAPSEHVVNQGFIRAWIAELLVARKQFLLAYNFYRAAYLKWKETAPTRATALEKVAQEVRNRISSSRKPDDASVERICLDWILGKQVDAA
jgi:tetratricopeptide (TPR) repeat protein